VVTAAKKYFGMIETPRVRYHEGRRRVFLNRRKETYDLIPGRLRSTAATCRFTC
jgi:hypothetical protein